MVQIERTDDGRLRISNRRQSGLVDDVEQARRQLYRWGHTDLSINKAVMEFKVREGGKAPTPGWGVPRPGADATAGRTPGTVPAPEATAAPSSPKSENGMRDAKSPKRRTGKPAAAPAEPTPVADTTPAATPKARGRGASKKTDGTAAATVEVRSPEPVADKPSATPKPRRSRARPKKDQPPEPQQQSTEAPPASIAPPARPTRKKPAASSEVPPDVSTAAASDVPDGKTASPEAKPRRRKASTKRAAAEPAPVAMAAETAEQPTPAEEPKPSGARKRRRGAVESPTSGDATVAARPAEDPIQQAKRLFAEGAAVLRDVERGVLEFARGPWTELRESAEEIVNALSGKSPRRKG